MSTETLANRIKRIRDRLTEIENERSSLPSDDFDRRSELMDEERTLDSRLAELKDEAAREGNGLAETQAREATEYERVPDVPPQQDERDRLVSELEGNQS